MCFAILCLCLEEDCIETMAYIHLLTSLTSVLGLVSEVQIWMNLDLVKGGFANAQQVKREEELYYYYYYSILLYLTGYDLVCG